MKKFFKRFLLIAAIFIGMLLLVATIALNFFQKQLGDQLINQLNKQLITELQIEQLDFTVIRSFPSVAATLKGVNLKDTRGGALLEAEAMSFRFGLLSIFKSAYEINTIQISRGALVLHTDKKGKPNYLVFREATTDQANTEGPTFKLREAILEDIELVYEDESLLQTLSTVVREATFTGELSSTRYTLQSAADLDIRFVEHNGERYLPGKRVAYSADVAIDLDKKHYGLKEVKLTIGENTFQVNGTVDGLPDGPLFDLQVSNDRGNLASVLQLLPDEYQAYFSDFSSTGDFTFNTIVEGQLRPYLQPSVRMEITLDNGRISSPRLKDDFRDVSLRASFTNGKYRSAGSAAFEITQLKGYFNRELNELRLRVENLEDPRVDVQLNGAIPLASIYGLFNSPSVTEGSGEIEVRDLTLQGRLADMRNIGRIDQVKTSGQLTFDDASLIINGEKLLLDRGSLLLDNNQFTLNDLRLEGAGSDIRLEGKAANVLPVLFADSLNSQQVTLDFQATLLADNLDLDRLLVAGKLKLAEKDTTGVAELVVDSIKSAAAERRSRLVSFLQGQFTTTIKSFNYELIEGRDFNGNVDFTGGNLTIAGQTKTMQGEITLDGQVFYTGAPRLEAKITCDNIDAREFFRQNKNFGQDLLQDKQLSGRLNARIFVEALFDAEGNFLPDQLHVLAGLAIQDGELKDFELLKGFSKFVKVEDLMNIRLVDLQNYLEIQNRTLYMPAMFIQSNAMNLTVSGEHNLDNAFNYNIKVNAGQILANKFRKFNPALDPVPAKQKGFINLHYRVFGTLDNYEYKSDKRRVKADFAASEARKAAIRRQLERYFGPLDLMVEPENWQDASGQDGTQYLDFDVQGGNSKNE